MRKCFKQSKSLHRNLICLELIAENFSMVRDSVLLGIVRVLCMNPFFPFRILRRGRQFQFLQELVGKKKKKGGHILYKHYTHAFHVGPMSIGTEVQSHTSSSKHFSTITRDHGI